MGDVYLAEQLRVGRRPVALKVLNRSCCENPDLKRRFENEAASAGRIHHPNVVMIYECRATDDGQLYVAMQFVEGTDLGKAIEERGALPVSEVGEITRQAAAGLSAAHKLGIVHRDIKPANIMLTRDDDDKLVVKVLDFGIARLSEPDSTGGHTKTGVVMGTPNYMSPEQALGKTGDKIDARSDIYSLAMAAYQMLTGRVAFEADSWMQVIYKHINEPVVPPSELRGELAALAGIDQVILKGLEKDREKRYQTVTEFANDLDAACTGHRPKVLEETSTVMYPGSGSTERAPFASSTKAQPIAPPTLAGSIEVTDPSGERRKGTVAITPQDAGSFKSIPLTPSKPPIATGTVHGRAAVPTSSTRFPAGKRIAVVVSGIILLGLGAAAYVVTRGPGDPDQQMQVAGRGGAGNEARKERSGRGGAEFKEEGKGETAASRSKQGEPGQPGRNPRETSPGAVQPTPAPVTEKEAGNDACLRVTVSRGGNPLEGCFVTVTDLASGKSYEGSTGPQGVNRTCGLIPGHQVSIRVLGPARRLIGDRTVVLKPDGNPVQFQG
jgi:serine/threonine-protein kinase